MNASKKIVPSLYPVAFILHRYLFVIFSSSVSFFGATLQACTKKQVVHKTLFYSLFELFFPETLITLEHVSVFDTCYTWLY